MTPTAELIAPEIPPLLEARAFREVRDTLGALEFVDAAEVLETLIDELGDLAAAAVAFRVLPRESAAEVFAHLRPEVQEPLIAELGEDRAWRIVEDMEPDDRAKLIDELPIEVTTPLLGRLTRATRRETQAILGYPAESVGRLMTTEYVRVRPGWTVARSLEHIRHYGEDAETLNWVYVIDAEGRLIDDLHIRSFLLADPSDTVGSLMDHSFVSLDATEDREEAVRAMSRYDRSALPVLDRLGLLVGIVTHDDMADIAELEATEDIQKLGGVEALGKPYLEIGLREMLRKRGGWLVGLFAMQIMTIGVMTVFEEKLAAATILAVFIPLIISSGGNTGTQAASLLVRAVAIGEVNLRDAARVLRREVAVGVTLGLALGVLGFGTTLALDAAGFATSEHSLQVAAVVAISVVAIVVWGAIAGSMFPLILEKMGLDPAASSSPLVATLMDVSGLTIYFVIATLLLTGLLL